MTKLQENNLLHHDYNSYYPCDFVLGHPKQKPMCRIFHQKHDWFLMPLPGFNLSNKLKMSGAMFTTVGRELLQIVDIEPDSEFLEKVRSYFKGHHLQMIAA